MFIGHMAAGFASKRVAPQVSLGWLITAGMLVDLLFPLFFLLGIEQVQIVPGSSPLTSMVFPFYPFTHSLAGSLGWALAFGLLYWLLKRDRRGSTVLSLVVLSHWLLDAITHRPDMALYPGGPVVGLGLWNSVFGTVLVEGVLFIVALWLYVSATRAKDRIGVWALGALIALLALLYWKHVAGPPPPSSKAMAWAGLLAWLFPLWALWIDRHRIYR